MDRKEFLKVLWFKFFKPILLLGVLIFSIRFLIRVFTQNDTERFIAIIVLGLVILATISYLLGLILKKIKNQIKSKLSDKSLKTIKIIGSVIDYLLLISLGMIIYHAWQEGILSAIGFFGAFLIFQIVEIVKKEKQI